MEARFRSWWQKRHKLLFVIGIIALLVVAGVLIWASYANKWGGAGFYNKTLWDWLQLLIVPLVLALIALVFQLANSRTEHQLAKQRYEQDQHIALDKQREDLLQTYLDRMSELLLEKSLLPSPSEEVRNVARVRTTAVLTQLDARRIGYVFAFLREAGLMSTTSNDNVVRLGSADLHAVNWSQADLRYANLYNADLWGANLYNANLWRASLSKAYLSEANLYKANFHEADLSNTNLLNANLSEANLSEANLYKAKVTDEQLAKAKSLEGATMPDGSIHS